MWVKPHALVPAAAVWLATARRDWPRDAAGYALGGGLVGAAGVGYLVWSGTWAAFGEVFTVWNQGYFSRTRDELPQRLPLELVYFPPWSYLHVAAVPLAAYRLWRGDAPGRALAALYLAWAAQALFIQRHIHYVHVPETLLMLAVFAAARWPVVSGLAAWFLLLPLATSPPDEPDGLGARPDQHTGWRTRHPALDADRMGRWADCWRPMPAADAARRMDAVALVKRFHGAVTWAELDELAGWLRAQGAGDREVLAWDDSPHAVYLALGIKPGFRFQHVHQMRGNDRGARGRVDAELAAALPRVRWVVGDLRYLAGADPLAIGDWTAAGPDKLPPGLSTYYRGIFPFVHPAVYRTGGGHGRFVVYDATRLIDRPPADPATPPDPPE